MLDTNKNRIINCPFCHNNLSKKLIANFFYCPSCYLAIREEKDMPAFEYSDNWVYSQYYSKKNKIRANFIAKMILKIKKGYSIR